MARLPPLRPAGDPRPVAAAAAGAVQDLRARGRRGAGPAARLRARGRASAAASATSARGCSRSGTASAPPTFLRENARRSRSGDRRAGARAAASAGSAGSAARRAAGRRCRPDDGSGSHCIINRLSSCRSDAPRDLRRHSDAQRGAQRGGALPRADRDARGASAGRYEIIVDRRRQHGRDVRAAGRAAGAGCRGCASSASAATSARPPAFAAGFAHARGRFIVTSDGDLQNDPRDIPAMVEHARAAAADIVARLAQGPEGHVPQPPAAVDDRQLRSSRARPASSCTTTAAR